ncbi:ATP-binding protein [Streptomyces sp. x-80]|uniref:ATP-binding protein n=1 Tax=Streptomyces sp. x-80 TaxID=2789282 RepID=UPI00398100DF
MRRAEPERHRPGAQSAKRLFGALGGLRGRLTAAFVLGCLLITVTATALAYRQARTAIVERVQAHAMQELRSSVADAAADFDVPPDQRSLTRFAMQVAEHLGDTSKIMARYGTLTGVSDETADYSLISNELRDAISREGRLVFQRINRDDGPYLAVGTPVLYTDNKQPSGVAVLSVSSLDKEATDSQALLAAVRDGTLPVLGVAALIALLSAGAVLRPVRRLERAAGRLADGGLDARVEVRGRDELASLARTFNTMADALETSVADLREQEERARHFVADVSHELRTPLAAMTIVSAVLDEDEGTLPPDTAYAARTISAETARLTRLVDDLIEISRFDAGAATLSLTETDLGETVRATLSLRGWTDRVEAELPQDVRLVCDRRRVDVIVANLIGNALRHGAAPVEVALTDTPEEVTVTVTDHGKGLPADVARHVFDRFYKADASRARLESADGSDKAVGVGSGLGLAIALENARLHGGTLTAANRPGAGACFTLRLPRWSMPPHGPGEPV